MSPICVIEAGRRMNHTSRVCFILLNHERVPIVRLRPAGARSIFQTSKIRKAAQRATAHDTSPRVVVQYCSRDKPGTVVVDTNSNTKKLPLPQKLIQLTIKAETKSTFLIHFMANIKRTDWNKQQTIHNVTTRIIDHKKTTPTR